MDKVKNCELIQKATYLVHVFIGQEPFVEDTTISIGSGVAINSRGDLLTATHVVAGGPRVTEKDIEETKTKRVIVAAVRGGPLLQYRPLHWGQGFQIPDTKEPLALDLALLRSVDRRSKVPYLSICRDSVPVGTEVLMAGHPDDMELPFELERIVAGADSGSNLTWLRRVRHLLMIKSGMIGHSGGIVFDSGDLKVHGEVLYVDNELHSGASGGPVVNADGEIVGTITKRAVTQVRVDGESRMQGVPSGSTVAVSPRMFLHEINRLGITEADALRAERSHRNDRHPQR